MKLVDFWHVPKQDVLLAVQVVGDEMSHGRVVHLCRVALDFNITHLVKASAFSPTNVRSRCHYQHSSPPAHTAAPRHKLSPSPAARSSRDWNTHTTQNTMRTTKNKHHDCQIIDSYLGPWGMTFDPLPAKHCQVFFFFWKRSMSCATVVYRRLHLKKKKSHTVMHV